MIAKKYILTCVYTIFTFSHALVSCKVALEKPFVIIIPSYNNKDWYEINLSSALKQEYSNYRVIYIADAPSDDTTDLVEQFINNHDTYRRVTLIKNSNRSGALANLFKAIHSCEPHEIIITLDGDDWLYTYQVLDYLNSIYQDPNVWMTYGQFKQYPSDYIGWCKQIDESVITKNSYRDELWVSSHLRSFYAWLFQLIDTKDLQKDGEFYPMAWDLAIMFPMLEMAGTHSKFIDEILYVYNRANSLNDEKIDQEKQLHLGFHIRSLRRYTPLTDFDAFKYKMGIKA